MHDSFAIYTSKRISNFNKGIVNLLIFLPYFFSATRLLSTLFSPWKNIITTDTTPGFSFSEFGQRLADNFVSRFMGFVVRSAILGAYLIVQIGFVVSLPLIYIGFLLLIPLNYGIYLAQPTPEQRKKTLYENFMKRHLTEPENKTFVEQWFEMYYTDIQELPWWELKNLMNTPPLGRDLTSGYTPELDKFATELTKQQPHYEHLIGRQAELERMQDILIKTESANILLVGEEGVGRRTVVEALSKIIYEGKCNNLLAYKRILELDIEKVLASTEDFVKRQELISDLFKEAITAKNIIIYISNIEKYVSEGKDNINLSGVFEKYATHKDIQFIATTTPYMYQKFIFSNQKINEIFEKVEITEVNVNQALDIMLYTALELEKRHKVAITYSALKNAVLKTDRYISNMPLPEKAIQLLDEASIFANQHLKTGTVTGDVVNTVLEQKIHIPTEVDSTLKNKLLHLDEMLKQKVLFQDNAIQKLSATLRKSFVMLGSRRKPLASFLFLGPTGVGKTETAKAVTEVFFNSSQNMIRFDMSIYQSLQDIPKLLGSSETKEPGLLTEAVRKQRFGTLLLDELEKAHHDLLNIFLTILDEGYFTDGYGEKVDCTNLIIIATSNAGADYIYTEYTKNPGNVQQINAGLIDYLIAQKIYSPEFLNRFDGVVVYNPLTQEAVGAIAQKVLQNLQEEVLLKHKITLTFTPEFLRKLTSQGYDPRFGARNMQRIIRDEVEDKLAKMILAGTITPGSALKL